MHYTCPNCAAINRIPTDKTATDAVCGRCKSALFNGQPTDLTDQNFSRFIKKNDFPIIVDFWASWCGPCKMMAPVFSNLSEQMQSQLRFAKVNTEEAQQTSTRLGIRSIPTLILYHQGKEIDRLAGALPEQQLRQWLEQGLSRIN